MDTREKLNEFAELQGWNKNKLIGWSEAADFGEWLVNCTIGERISAKDKKFKTTWIGRIIQIIDHKSVKGVMIQMDNNNEMFIDFEKCSIQKCLF